MEIIHAGYGIDNRTCNATDAVMQTYNGGEREFFAHNNWCGDPAPGLHKSLFIVWEDDGNFRFSGVVREGDNRGILLPDP